MTWYSGDTKTTVIGVFDYLRAKLELNSWTKKMLIKTVTYSGGSGTLPSVGATITWDSAASSGTLVQQVSGDNAAGVMKIDVGTGELESADSLASAGGWSATVSSLDDFQYVVQGPGPSAGREFYVGLHLDPSYPTIIASALTGYSAGNYTIATQPGYSVGSVERQAMPSANGVTSTLWLSVTDTRFVLAAKVSTYYHLLSAGVLSAYGTDVQYGYPIYTWGSFSNWISAGSRLYNNANHTWQGSNLTLRLPGGTYSNPTRINTIGNTAVQTYSDNEDVILPYVVKDTNNMYGYIPGVGGGPTGTAESTFTVGGDTWIMFPDVTVTSLNSDMTLVKQA